MFSILVKKKSKVLCLVYKFLLIVQKAKHKYTRIFSALKNKTAQKKISNIEVINKINRDLVFCSGKIIL